MSTTNRNNPLFYRHLREISIKKARLCRHREDFPSVTCMRFWHGLKITRHIPLDLS